MNPVSIEGGRVRLRDLSLDDLADLGRWMMPEQAWHRLDGPNEPQSTPNKVREMMAVARANVEAGDWPVPRRRLYIAGKRSNRLLGMVTASWKSRETNWLVIGIVLFDPTTWRQGLGYEAFGLWSDYLFTSMPEIVRLDLRTWSGNIGMMQVAQRLGYQEEARFRRARIVDGTYYDGLGYGILREEWESRYPEGFAASLADRSPDAAW